MSSESAPAATADRAEIIAHAVLATPGVHDLHAGAVGQVATYLPGRRVNGIRARPDKHDADGGYDIHIVLAWGAAALTTADAVRASVQAVAPGRVDVTIEDVAPKSTPRLETSL
ncbi:hypothetical protein V3G39_01535 [Dermatophilaceae bacterium Sec6.4]|nr:hypothetical protein [Actinomycetota bacterium]